MVTTNNLSDVANPPTAFNNIKQAATTSATGAVELATTAETTTGTDTGRAVTPDGLHDMTSLAGAAWFLDEDTMSSNSATKVASQQSIKAHVATEIAAIPAAGFTLGTEQATTSGSSKTFSSIPAGTTMIVVMLEGVSFTGQINTDVTIGDAGGLETSGYISSSASLVTTAVEVFSSTAEFVGHANDSAGSVISGQFILTLKDAANFTWICSHNLKSNTNKVVWGAGEKSLSAELTQVSISGGTFDGGSVNIMYQ